MALGKLGVAWHLIPDGASTIVKIDAQIEFATDSEGASQLAEQVSTKLISILTGQSFESVKNELAADLWLGETDRPDEAGG